VIVRVAITNTVTKALTGIDGDFAAVTADLADGWTLCAKDWLAEQPSRLEIIGRRYAYIALLNGYELPADLCSCFQTPCVCKGTQLTDGETPGVLKLIGAHDRKAWDGSENDVLENPRFEELLEHSRKSLDQPSLRLLTKRWDHAHRERIAASTGLIGQWKELNKIRLFVAREYGAFVPLASQPFDPERLAEGQLVLLTSSAGAANPAARDFVYRLPNLDVPLRVEDLSERELVIDCGEEDLVRVERYLLDQQGRRLRLTLDPHETDRQIEREARALRQAGSQQRLRRLIAEPTLAGSSPRRLPLTFFNKDLDPEQQAFVRASLDLEDLVVAQGPPGTGKTTAIVELVQQFRDRFPDAQILLAAPTHQAVDNVLLRLAQEDPDIPIARIASELTIDRVNDLIRKRYWTESTEPWYPPIVRRAIAYRQLIEGQIRAHDRTNDKTMREVLTVQDDYLASVGPQRTPSERLAQARVIAGTCASVQGSPELGGMRFPLAILEEAGKAMPAEALMLMLRGEKNILVGDSRQLPPHPWEPMRAVLRDPDTLTARDPNRADEVAELRAAIHTLGSTAAERQATDEQSLFDRFAEHLIGSEHHVALTTQYRMLAPIGELVGQVFYGDIGGLQHSRQRPIDPRVQAFAGETRVRLVDIPGREQEGAHGMSKLRPAETEHIRRELRAIQDTAESIGPPPDGPERLGVAVITPYAAQSRDLRKHLDLTLFPALDVRIGIVDGFQGDEDQVVILSVAATTVAGFLYLPNRINVAVSRAQDLLIITTSLPAAIRGHIGAPLKHVADFINRKVQAGDPAYHVLRARRPPE
jgi:ATP-dependent RNA/DNA helicase IGHMBP2